MSTVATALYLLTEESTSSICTYRVQGQGTEDAALPAITAEKARRGAIATAMATNVESGVDSVKNLADRQSESPGNA